MACTRYRLIALLGTCLLPFSLPACSGPFLATRVDASPGESRSLPNLPRGEGPASTADEQRPHPAAPPAPAPTGGEGGEQPGREQDGRSWLSSEGAADGGGLPASPWDRLRLDFDLGREDYGHFYSAPNLGLYALGIALAAPLANTPADRTIERWYQERVKVRELNGLATAATYGCQLWFIAPVCLEAAALAGWADAGSATDGGLYEWGNRSLRAAAVGFPPVLASFVLLGAHRPDRGDSSWHPFQDVHGVSGHTFAGAIPFLTAAAMTDSPYWKAPLVLGSFLTGWARLHDDRHYFSQVALGWWLAYLSVRSVGQTQAGRRSFTLTPILGPDGPGMALSWQY